MSSKIVPPSFQLVLPITVADAMGRTLRSQRPTDTCCGRVGEDVGTVRQPFTLTERYRIAPQCDSQSLAVHFARVVDADDRDSAQIEMALPVDECLVGLRNKFTIREHRACPQFVASFHLDYFGVLFPEARDLPPRRSKILGAIFQRPAKLQPTRGRTATIDGTGTTFRPGVGNPPGNAGGHRRGPA